MKIAIFQEQPYHSEIFGFLFNFFKNNILTIDLYFNHTYNQNSYVKFYKDLYNIDINFFNISDFKYKEIIYDKIIVTTLPSPDSSIKFSNPEKIILIKHRKEQNIPNSFNFGLSHLIDKNFIFPVFQNNIKNKDELSKNILIMGNFKHKNIKDLIVNLKNFNNYNFILVSRSLLILKKKLGKFPNLKFYNNIPTAQLIDMLYNDIDFFLLLNKIPSIYHNKSISGGVFQALSFNIPIICDEIYHNIYNYPESIVYKKSIIEILPILNEIDIKNYQSKQANIAKYIESIISLNNDLLNNYFSKNSTSTSSNNTIINNRLVINRMSTNIISPKIIPTNIPNNKIIMSKVKTVDVPTQFISKISTKKNILPNIKMNIEKNNSIKKINNINSNKVIEEEKIIKVDNNIKNNLLNINLKKIKKKK